MRARGILTRWAAAALCGLAALSTTSPVAASQADLAPTSGALLGAYVKPDAWDQAGVKASILDLEQRIGRKLGIDHHFYRWDLNFPTWQESWDISNGRIPMMSWGGVSTTEINAGTHDAWIRSRADAVKALGAPVLLRWFYEMDAKQLAAKAGTPSDFITAWRRIHGIFEARGATNVLWVWCGTASHFKTGKAQSFYPGDAYVDWIAADGYNWYPAQSTATWTELQSIFSGFYPWASVRGKPLMIAETGALEHTAGRKAQWIRNAGATVKQQFPKVKALVYLDAVASAFDGGSFDWRIDSSSSSEDAFRSVAMDPYFGGPAVEPPPPIDEEPPPIDEEPPPPIEEEPPPIEEEPPATTHGSGRPDGSIGRKDRPGKVGKNVINLSGADQTWRTGIRAGSRRAFDITFQNTGETPDIFRIWVCGSSRHLRVRRVSGEGLRGTKLTGFTAPPLAPGESISIRLVVKARAGTPRGKVLGCRVQGTSPASGKADVVRAILRARR